MSALLESMSINDLRNAIWMDKNCMAPVGGYPREWYEDELFHRTGSRKIYHEGEVEDPAA